MKRFIVFLLIVGLVFSLTAPAYADGPVKKLGRGVANVVTSPFEIFKGMGDTTDEQGIFAGLTWGLFQGTVNLVKRAAVGVFEIATFPIPIPEDYGPILTDPEFFLEDR